MKHLIIGGGLAGLNSAYLLAKEGHEVTVIDRDASKRESCSNRNAGMIVPSHFIPLAAPGVIGQGIRWMMNRKSPFALRPQLRLSLWSWCYQFWRHSNAKHVGASRELLRDLSFQSRTLFEQLSDELGFPLQKRGLLMLCQSEEGFRDEKEVAQMADEIGVEAEVCGKERLKELDPSVEINALGGVWFPQDCHLDSEEFLLALRRGIKSHGGDFLSSHIKGFRQQNGSVTHALTEEGEALEADAVTIACGAWSSELGKKLGQHLPLQAGKGYSFTLPKPAELPELCSLLKEGRVAVTPMGETLRVAGTMEICGNDLSVNQNRLDGIVESFCRFFPAFKKSDFYNLEPWSGLRPCSPDGLPYIGRAKNAKNVMFATGHAMLGLSLAPITGRLIADAFSKNGEVDPRLDPGRF